MTGLKSFWVVGASLALCTTAACSDGAPVNIVVVAHTPGPQVSQIEVMLTPGPAAKATCPAVSANAVVEVDGVKLKPAQADKTRPATISTMQLPAGCRPPTWRSPAGHVFATQATSRVSITDGETKIVVVAEDLMLQRRIEVSNEDPVQVGGKITLTWLPEGDRWDGDRDSASIKVSTSEASRLLEPPGVHLELPTFDFVLPKFAVGEVELSLLLGQLQPRARVRSCRGASVCSVFVRWAPEPIKLTIAGVRPRL